MSVQFLTAWLCWWYENLFWSGVPFKKHVAWYCKMLSKFNFLWSVTVPSFLWRKTEYILCYWWLWLFFVRESGCLICFGSHGYLSNKSFRISSLGSLMPCQFTHWELAWILSFDPVKQPFPCLMQKISGLQKTKNDFTLVFNIVHKDFEMQSEDNIYL